MIKKRDACTLPTLEENIDGRETNIYIKLDFVWTLHVRLFFFCVWLKLNIMQLQEKKAILSDKHHWVSKKKLLTDFVGVISKQVTKYLERLSIGISHTVRKSNPFFVALDQRNLFLGGIVTPNFSSQKLAAQFRLP